MEQIFKGVRPLDYVLTAALEVIAILLALANIHAGPDAGLQHPLDSQSAWILPVFVVATLPILWRRRNILAVIATSFVVLAASVVAFGWVTRCGFALPLSWAMAYAVARFAGSRTNQILGLVGVLGVQVAALVKDSANGGLGALALAVPVGAVCYGIGLFVQSTAGKRAAAPTLSIEHVHA